VSEKIVTFCSPWLYREIIVIIVYCSVYQYIYIYIHGCVVCLECLNNSSLTMRRCNRFCLELQKKTDEEEKRKKKKKK
jgi:hypothetical protein